MNKLQYIALSLAIVAGLGFQQSQAMTVDVTGSEQEPDLTALFRVTNDETAVALSVPANAHHSPKHRKHGRRNQKGRDRQVAEPKLGGHGTVPPIPDPIPSATPGGHGTVPPVPDPFPQGTVPPIPDPIPSVPPSGPSPFGGSGPEVTPPNQVQSVPEGGSTLMLLGFALGLGEVLRRMVRRRVTKHYATQGRRVPSSALLTSALLLPFLTKRAMTTISWRHLRIDGRSL
jgi:hypothetical protein